MGILGLLPADIRKKLNYRNLPQGFLGSDGTITDADVEETIDEFEETAFSRMPQRYQDLLTACDGEILTRDPGGALGTETSFTVSLYPCDNLLLYKNFGGKTWAQRTPFDAMTEGADYTLDKTTGVITLPTVLSKGDRLFAEYTHTAASGCKLLRRIVKDLCATEWARRLNPDDEQFERYTEWETQAYSDLSRMSRPKGDEARQGIRTFDRIKLVYETRSARMTAPVRNPGGSML